MYETDIELWKQMAGQDNNRWDDRSSLFSRFIRPHDAVLDLGAGDHKLKNYLPSSEAHYESSNNAPGKKAAI